MGLAFYLSTSYVLLASDRFSVIMSMNYVNQLQAVELKKKLDERGGYFFARCPGALGVFSGRH